MAPQGNVANQQQPQGQQGRGGQPQPNQQNRQNWQNRPPRQPQAPRATYRLVVTGVQELAAVAANPAVVPPIPALPARFEVRARLLEDNSRFTNPPGGTILVPGETVHFGLAGGPVLAAAVTDNLAGEVVFTYAKVAGQTGNLTFHLVAHVPGGPVSADVTVAINSPVLAPPASAPQLATPGLVVPIISRRMLDTGGWQYTVGVSTEDAQLFGHPVTFIGHLPRPVVVNFDAQGTAFADFTAHYNVAEVNVLVSISRKPWQAVVNVQRPEEVANVEVMVREKYWQNDGDFLVVAVRANVDQTVWRDGKTVRLWIEGHASEDVLTHNGIAEFSFGIPHDHVANLGANIRFGALVLGTDDQDRDETPLPIAHIESHFVRESATGWFRGGNWGLHVLNSRDAWRALYITLLFAALHLVGTAIGTALTHNIDKVLLPLYAIGMILVVAVDLIFSRVKPAGPTKYGLLCYGGLLLAIEAYRLLLHLWQ